MKELPLLLTISFLGITVTAIYLFYRASRSRFLLNIMISWVILQSIAAALGFFAPTDILPPRLTLLIIPPVVALTLLCLTIKGKRFLDRFDPRTLTLIHVLRIPVEIILYFLFLYGVMPDLMTFEGRNFDIFSGITAPLIFYFGYVKKKLNKNILLGWNFLTLAILALTVTTGIFSAPTPLQLLAFDRPSVAVMHFPMVLLPGIVVPIVYFAHIITIRNLLASEPKAATWKDQGDLLAFPSQRVN